MSFARHLHAKADHPSNARSQAGNLHEANGGSSANFAEENQRNDNDAADYPPAIGMSRAQQQRHIAGSDTPSARAPMPSSNEHAYRTSLSSPASNDSQNLNDGLSQTDSGETAPTSIHTLPALQAKGLPNPSDRLEPLEEDDGSYDLIAPREDYGARQYSLETRSQHIFSHEHLQAIFKDPSHLIKFSNFLGQHRKASMPTLIYYLEALKSIRAINYANAVSLGLEPLDGLDWTREPTPAVQNQALEKKAELAFNRLVAEDLPAYVTHTWIALVSVSIHRRITGTLPPHLREASEGLAEVFCLTDPSRQDNPIVFASEEFHQTTQYGMTYVIGRNCRFLQGPQTSPDSVRRLREACLAGKEVCETFLNYRRDGSPFMNLLMMAPLRDSRGQLRYFIGAQVDVSGLAREAADLEALQTMLADEAEGKSQQPTEHKDEMRELSEMFNVAELETVRKTGGRLHHDRAPDDDNDSNAAWQRPRLLLKDNTPPLQANPSADQMDLAGRNLHGKLSGIYSQYLLIRPYPSLRILFTSPSLRVPGILQSPFMNRIGSSERVREELVAAFAEGRGVTAKVRWVARGGDDEGRPRWIHCTPLLGHNGAVGVWMVVLVEDDDLHAGRKYRTAPTVPLQIDRKHARDAAYGPRESGLRNQRSQGSIKEQRGRGAAPVGAVAGNVTPRGAAGGFARGDYPPSLSAGSTNDTVGLAGSAEFDFGTR